YARHLAEANHGCIVVMLVFSEAWCLGAWPVPSAPPPVVQVEGAEIDWLRTTVDAVPDEIPVTHLTSRGPVGPALAHAALRHNCDAVVIGRRPWRSWPGALERYLRAHAAVPVIAVPSSQQSSSITSAADDPDRVQAI